ncbi:hypothetical protein D3C75_894230 [compost metagenome]
METDIGREAEGKDEQGLQGKSDPRGDILGIIDGPDHHHATSTRQHDDDPTLQWQREEDAEIHPQTDCNATNQRNCTDMLFALIRQVNEL